MKEAADNTKQVYHLQYLQVLRGQEDGQWGRGSIKKGLTVFCVSVLYQWEVDTFRNFIEAEIPLHMYN